jgi:hypothetical protein
MGSHENKFTKAVVQAGFLTTAVDFLMGGPKLVLTDANELQIIEKYQNYVRGKMAEGNLLQPSYQWEEKVRGYVERAFDAWEKGILSAMIVKLPTITCKKPDLFGFALGGNLMWAAMVFFPLGGSVATITTFAAQAGVAAATFGGAVIGSGIAQQFASGRPVAESISGEGFRNRIMKRTAEIRGDLRESFLPQVWKNWAREMYLAVGRKEPSSFGSDVHEKCEMIIFRKIFPSVCWKRKETVFQELMKEGIQRVLDDFNRQYDAWERTQCYLRNQSDVQSFSWRIQRPNCESGGQFVYNPPKMLFQDVR